MSNIIFDPLLSNIRSDDSDNSPDDIIKYDVFLDKLRLVDKNGGIYYDYVLNMVRNGTVLNQNAWYGIERDETIASADWTRIAGAGQMSLHASLPVQSSLKGVLLNADKTVNYYLKADDWTKKADGTASVLTGADGNVMVRKDSDTYWKFETDGNIQRVKCSMYPLVGFSKIDKWNIGAYEAKLVSTKLSSVAGVLPTTSRSETQFRTDARANGAGYHQQWYEPYTEIVWMFIVEYATNNFQKAVNATLTAQGYKQGGLGNGVTTANGTEWSAYNGYNPFIPCGSSNSLANGSGEVATVIPNFGGAGANRTFTVPRYRGIENLFGHIWKWVDGVSFNHLAATREVWIFDDPALIVDNTSVNARLAGNLVLTDGWIKTILFGDSGDILPASIGESSTTGYCDYLYTPALGSGWKALFSGGNDGGAGAGPLSATTYYGASSAYARIGARLFAR
jgi:hypothetical protein